jgi:hypothetical protein
MTYAAPEDTRDGLLNVHPEARSLSVYDGRRLCGYLIVLPYPKPSWAFDRHERCLGAHRSLKQAVAAVNAAYDAEVRHA